MEPLIRIQDAIDRLEHGCTDHGPNLSLSPSLLLALGKLQERLLSGPGLYRALATAPAETLAGVSWLTDQERQELLHLVRSGIASFDQLARQRAHDAALRSSSGLVPMAVQTVPGARCWFGSSEGVAEAEHMYADGEGVVRFYVRSDDVDLVKRSRAYCREGGVTTCRDTTSHAIGLSPRGGRPRPALTGEVGKIAPAYLRSHGYPPRPSKNDEIAYAHWLRMVSRESWVVEPVAISTGFQNRISNNQIVSAPNVGVFCGFELLNDIGASSPIISATGTVQVANVSLPGPGQGYGARTSLWVGISGSKELVSTPLVQAGVSMRQTYYQLAGFCAYFPYSWWQVFPQVSEQWLYLLPTWIGDEIYVHVSVSGDTAFFYLHNQTRNTTVGQFGVTMNRFNNTLPFNSQPILAGITPVTWTGSKALWILETSNGMSLVNFGTTSIGFPAMANDSSGNYYTSPINAKGGLSGANVIWDFIVDLFGAIAVCLPLGNIDGYSYIYNRSF